MSDLRSVGQLGLDDLGFRVIVGEGDVVLWSIQHLVDRDQRRPVTRLNDGPLLDPTTPCEVEASG